MVQNTRTAKGAGGVRPLGLPQPIEVRADRRGWPVAIKLNRRWVPVTVEDRWRIDDEWWRDEPLERIYYRLQVEHGRVLIIYHDLHSGNWAEQPA